MDGRTLKALKGSIAKWQAIVNGTGEDKGETNCPLCQVFHPNYAQDDGQQACAGCPVMERTGKSYCHGTPYDDWNEGNEDDDEEIAKEELAFLTSLLPDEADKAA